jgi:hypothetical protein
MNRRQLMSVSVVPLFGLDPLPQAVAAAVSGDPAPTPRTDSDDDAFYAAIMFDRGKVEFVVRGIYSVKAESDAHMERLKAAGHSPCASFQVNRAWLQEHFIGERMGALKDVLERLEARLMIDAHGA